VQAPDRPDNPETEEAKALLGEGIKTCRKIITNNREALLAGPAPGEGGDEPAARDGELEG